MTTTLDLSIVIPFKDKSDLTLACIQTLETYNKDLVKEVILISNNSSSSELKVIKDYIRDKAFIKLIIEDIPFNFQTLNNIGIRASTGKVVMMLNNDTEFTKKSVGLLEKMYNKALEKEVGAVGATLLFEGGKTIQHAGVYLVPGGTADHLYINKPLKKVLGEGYAFDISKDLQVSAVTAAALMLSREHFDLVNGMDENFIVCGGDVDICLRLEDAGLKNYLIGAKNGTIIHKESKTRSLSNVPYVDFCESYKIYSKHFNVKTGDKHLAWKDVTNV